MIVHKIHTRSLEKPDEILRLVVAVDVGETLYERKKIVDRSAVENLGLRNRKLNFLLLETIKRANAAACMCSQNKNRFYPSLLFFLFVFFLLGFIYFFVETSMAIRVRIFYEIHCTGQATDPIKCKFGINRASGNY